MDVSKTPLISVVMSVFNTEMYLNKSIESILKQSYKNFEFIIIDDGSTDSSLSIILNYMKKDKRMVLISRENKGLPYSLNEGIDKSKGKYIARMDADDISLSTRLAEQIEFMEKNNEIGIVGTWIEIFGNNISNKISKHPKYHNELNVRLLFSVCFAHPTVMIRKKVIDDYKLRYNEEYVIAQDYELWSRMEKVTRMANIQKVLLLYRIFNTSITNTKRVELRYELMSKIFNKVLQKLNIQNTEEENKLHFTIGLNERISKENIDLLVLNIYLSKIIKANEKIKYFDEKFLREFLGKKFLVVFYFQVKRKNYQFFKALSSLHLYHGLVNIIKDKLFEK